MMLSGLGRVQRGAEAAFLEIARQLAQDPDTHVEVFGAGAVAIPGVTSHVIACRPRERFEHWPRFPCFRGEGTYEESSFVWNLARSGRYRPNNFDVVVTCTYPWVNWFVQWSGRKRRRPVHVFVTQNGDWPCQARNREFRFFRCDGLVCTNPVFFERHRHRHRAVLIPNGVDPEVFIPRKPGSNLAVPEIDAEGGPAGKRVVFMASAMISSKDVAGGVRAVAHIPEAFLVIAGDGPERTHVAELAASLLPGRHRLLGSLPRHRMPALFRRADVFLHMSREEPSALVYLEAASSGLPVVVHD